MSADVEHDRADRRPSALARRRTYLVLVLAIAASGVMSTHGHAWNTATDGAAPSPELGALHRVASRYATAGAALAAGYVPVWACGELVGSHVRYVHPHVQAGPALVLERPHALVYEVRSAGRRALLEVVYRVGHRAWHAAGNGLRPALLTMRFDLVERTGEEPYYEVVVRVATGMVRIVDQQDPPRGDCARVGSS